MRYLLLIILFSFYSALAQTKNYLAEGPYSQLIIRGATLINGNGAPPIGPVDIVIENDKITDVKVVGSPDVEINESKRPKLNQGGKEIDALGMFVLPGFMTFSWLPPR